MNSAVDESVAAKLLSAREDGSPVAPSTESLAAEMAAIARRRWNSYERHNPKCLSQNIKPASDDESVSRKVESIFS